MDTGSPVASDGDESDEQQHLRDEPKLIYEVGQFLLWLQEAERTTTNPLDVCDLTHIYNAADKLQTNIDELKLRCEELDRIKADVNETADDRPPSDALVRKIEKTDSEASRIHDICRRRQIELESLISKSSCFLTNKTYVESWLGDAKKALEGLEAPQKMDVGDVENELGTLEKLFEEMPLIKERISDMNSQSSDILKHYKRDECHRMSYALSNVVILWGKFNDNIRIRRAVLEASLTSRQDFNHALARFEEWLGEELVNINKRVDHLREADTLLANAASLRKFVNEQSELNSDIEAHAEVLDLITTVGSGAVEAIHDMEEKKRLRDRLASVRVNWDQLTEINKVLGSRITAAQDEHDQIEERLAKLMNWVSTQIEKIDHEQHIVGDPANIQRQSILVKELEIAVETKEKEVNQCITDVRSYLMRHDLRPRLQTSFIVDKTAPLSPDAEESKEAEFVQGVRMQTDCDRLEADWTAFLDQLSTFASVVQNAHREVSDLNNALAEALLTLSTLEAKVEKCKPVEELQLDQLKDAHGQTLILTHDISEGQVRVEDVNDCTGKIQAANIALSSHLKAQVKAVNQRCRKLKKDVQNRKQAIERALKDFGPSSEHFMIGSVKAPWQRAISQANGLPYYIDHVNKITQWDHPSMVSVMENLTEFNQVKFCAYRLAMKLRAIQKTVCLDLIELNDIKLAFEAFSGRSYGATIETDEMTMCLLPIFEHVHASYPDLLPTNSVIMNVDLTINLIFNIYDPCRDAVLRILSFQVVLVVFSKAELADKYKYLFQLVSSNDAADHKQLAVLFYELIQIPKFFGEAAAFGGSNVEPSVRSCFCLSHFPATVTVDDFLRWLKLEPQSFIWLPVMHRLCSSENLKHEAKCNVCKMYPIIGLRYRCMKCLNFDSCQNCFFSQRTSKNHKLTHPVVEYCIQTTSKDDLRDFGAILLNKLKSTTSAKAQKNGYLPLETVHEGQQIEARKTVPTNAESEVIHRHIQAFAMRLHKVERDQSKSTPSQTQSEPRPPPGMVKSPLQLILSVEQMEKDELDNLLSKLKKENRTLRHSLHNSRSHLSGSVGPTSGRPPSHPASTAALFRGRRRSSAGTGFTINDLGPPPDYAVPTGYSTLPAGGLKGLMAAAGGHKGLGDRTTSTPLYNDPHDDGSLPTTGRRSSTAHSMMDIYDRRLEQRHRILIEQNKLLQRQLQRLKKAVAKQGKDLDAPSPSSPKNNMPPNVYTADQYASENESDTTITSFQKVNTLINTVSELGQAMETFVVSVSNDDAADLFEP